MIIKQSDYLIENVNNNLVKEYMIKELEKEYSIISKYDKINIGDNMKNKLEQIVKKLTELDQTIATMESCTGGNICNAITNISGASKVFHFSAITYSNEAKIKIGVDRSIIDNYSVYSMETAHEMAFKISKYIDSDIGIGITGKLCEEDDANMYGENNVVFISIYYQNNYYDSKLELEYNTRENNKEYILNEVINMLDNILL